MKLEDLLTQLAALGRPVMPLLPDDHPTKRQWRADLEAWRTRTPDGDARYSELLEAIRLEEQHVETEQRERDRLAAWSERNRIPTRVSRALGAPQENRALTTALDWLKQPKPWLVLMGSTGVGKSVAAAAALHRCFQQGSSVAWVEAAEVATSAGGFNGQERADKLKAVDVLVVDDVGTDQTNDWALGILRGILQHRHEEQLRTIITTNLNGSDFRAHVGQRVADRIRGECVAVNLDGRSMRPEATP